MNPKNASWLQPSAAANRASPATVLRAPTRWRVERLTRRRPIAARRAASSSRNPPITVRKWPDQNILLGPGRPEPFTPWADKSM